MPDSSGPGRNSATRAPKSSNTVGFKSLTSFFIPPDSSWNTPSVSPLFKRSKVSGSSSGILFISRSIPWRILIKSRVSLMIVRVSSPRKSIFKRPSFSMCTIGYCVVVVFSFESAIGIISSSGLCEIITPAACVPTWFLSPSRCRASSTRRLTISFSSQSFFSSMPSFSASSSLVPGAEGIMPAHLLESENGMS